MGHEPGWRRGRQKRNVQTLHLQTLPIPIKQEEIVDRRETGSEEEEGCEGSVDLRRADVGMGMIGMMMGMTGAGIMGIMGMIGAGILMGIMGMIVIIGTIMAARVDWGLMGCVEREFELKFEHDLDVGQLRSVLLRGEERSG